ncbi:MAG: hypothetical protein RIE52_00780 [Balneola sp.]|jgi:hypothetical protein
MTIDEYINYLKSFLDGQEGFFYELNEEGIFDKEGFHKYTNIIYDLSLIELTEKEKYLSAILIWEISLKLERLLSYAKDSDDVLRISNLESEDFIQVSEILFYTSNWFSYDKPMEKKNLIIGSWF